MSDIPMTINIMTNGRSCTSDPCSANVIDALGGVRSGNVSISHDQRKQLMRVYNLRKVANNEPGATMVKAALDRDMFRLAQRDGVRIMAVIAEHIENGEDPVKFIVQMMIESGLDMGGLYEWIHEKKASE